MLARFQNHNNVPTARCETRGGRAWPGFEPTRRASAVLQAPPVWRMPVGPEDLAAVLVGDGRA